MKIIPFPKPGDERVESALGAQIDAALHGESRGEAADYWRELRADVRALASPISPGFERELRERIGRSAIARREPGTRPRSAKRISPRSALARAQVWLGSGLGPRLLAASGISAMAAVIALLIVAPWRTSPTVSEHAAIHLNAASQTHPGRAAAEADQSSSAVGAASGVTGESSSGAASGGGSLIPLARTAEPPPARVQQRAASITLAPKPADVQSVADGIAQLAAREGGFVQSSQVHLQHGAGGEANLQLSLPSARLSAALVELARLAPTRAQSQSLQDITDEYGAARTKLADAVAARQALLRALSQASTQGEIESLRARLSLAGGAITQARAAFQSVAKRGSNSAVEVTVLGDARAGTGESTLSKALHDAADVLKSALAVLIVALAVLVPLALLGVLVAFAWRASRRRLRERALS